MNHSESEQQGSSADSRDSTVARAIEGDVKALVSLFPEVSRETIDEMFRKKYAELMKIATVSDKSYLLIIARSLVQDDLCAARGRK